LGTGAVRERERGFYSPNESTTTNITIVQYNRRLPEYRETQSLPPVALKRTKQSANAVCECNINKE